jgi:hypothetical protein
MLTFERIQLEQIQWESIYGSGEINVFQTQPWLEYLAHDHEAELVIASINSSGHIVGYFTGLIIHKFGLTILGSPFRGWNTYFMGFNVSPEVTYREILEAFPLFAFRTLKCDYLEIIDPNIKEIDFEGLPYKVEALPWYAIDLTPTEDQLFANINSSGRRNIRKAMKNGIVIGETKDPTFADEYYAQYEDVLDKRSLVPTYSLQTVRNMIQYMQNTGNIHLVCARDSDNLCIATGIFVACNKRGVYWGGASWREHQINRPNEPLFLFAMKTLKAVGITELHMGGECDQFKQKLGSQRIKIFRLMRARNKFLGSVINLFFSLKGSKFRNWALKKISV